MVAVLSSSALQHHGWLFGLPVLSLIWAAATLHGQPGLERSVEAAARATATDPRNSLDAAGETWFRLAAEGRDLEVRGDAPDARARDMLLLRLADVAGARRIQSSVGLVEEVSPFVWTATQVARDRVELSGHRPAEIGRAQIAARLRADLAPSATLVDEARSARGGPPEFLDAAAFAAARLQALAPGAVATLRDTTLSLEGEAVGAEAYEALRAALASLPAGFSAGRIEIRAPQVADFRFAVERRADGGLTLTGNVVSEAARSALRKAAQEAAEGAAVEDRTRTARGIDPRIDPDALARFALEASGLLRDGRVSFEAGRLSAAGHALDGQAVAEIGTLLRDRRPTSVELGGVAVESVPLSPYRVALRRDADSVTLTGHLPDAASRERVLAALRPRFVRERVVDRTRIAEGAPPNLVALLETAIPQFATLASGELAVADREVTLSGDSLYPESGRRLRAAFPATLPAAWRASVRIGTPGAPERRDGETCRRDLAAETRAHPLRFSPGSSALGPDFYPVLDAVAALAKLCPDLKIEVAAHLDPPGSQLAKPQTEGSAVQTTASIDTAESRTGKAGAEAGAGARSGKTASPTKDGPHGKDSKQARDDKQAKDAAKSAKGQAAEGRPADKKAAGKAERAADPAPAEPEPDLARLRAQVIVEYLLQAGAGADQVAAAAGAPEAGAQSVVLTLRG